MGPSLSRPRPGKEREARPCMNWITDRIAIGNYVEAKNRDLLQEEGIRSALSLDRTLQGVEPSEIGLEAIAVAPLEDGPDNDLWFFRRAVEALTDLVQNHAPVLVQCTAGRSRSPVVVAGYLMKTQGLTAEEALALVASKRDIKVSPGLERLLENLV